MFRNEERDKELIKSIEEANGFYVSQQYEVKKQKRIEELLYDDYISKVKSYTTVYDIIKQSIEGAKDELKDDQTPKKGSRLELLTLRLKEDFLNNREIIVTGIRQQGFECYGYTIDFTFPNTGKLMYVFVPYKKNINKVNFEYTNYGRFAFGIYNKEWSLTQLTSSYSMDEISNFIDEYLEQIKENNESEGK